MEPPPNPPHPPPQDRAVPWPDVPAPAREELARSRDTIGTGGTSNGSDPPGSVVIYQNPPNDTSTNKAKKKKKKKKRKPKPTAGSDADDDSSTKTPNGPSSSSGTTNKDSTNVFDEWYTANSNLCSPADLAAANHKVTQETFDMFNAFLTSHPKLWEQRYVRKAFNEIKRGNYKVVKAVHTTWYKQESFKSGFFKGQMRIALGLEPEIVLSGTEDEQRSIPTKKPTKKSTTKSYKSADAARATGTTFKKPTTNTNSKSADADVKPKSEDPTAAATAKDPPDDMITKRASDETPTPQPDLSTTDQVNEDLSALTTYTYDTATNHSRATLALKQVNNLVRVVTTMQSKTDRKIDNLMRARDKKIDDKFDKLGTAMQTLAEMVTENIEYQ